MNRSGDKILDELIECSSPLISRPLHGCDAMELQRFKSTASSQCEHEPPNHDVAVEGGQIPESSDSPSKSDESCRTRSLVSKTTQCPGGSGSCSPSTPTSPVRATTSTSPTHTHTSPTHSPPNPPKAPTSPTHAPTSPTRAPTSPTRAPPKSNTCESCGQLMKLPDVKTQSINSISSSHSSSHSSHSSHSSVVDVCRICHCEVDNELGPLIAPCKCKGTLEFVHQSCLQQWIKSSDYKHCELCGFHFAMDSKLKPITKWEKLTMSTSERRKLICSVMFHIIAITCVVWSLYVLIERTAAELKSGDLYWPFWTKLVVVAIGFTGGLVFMYVQCKVYVQLWKRLKAFNRIIYVQNQPPNTEILKSTTQPPSDAAEDSHRNNTSSTNPHRNSITSQCDINVIVEICDPPVTPVVA